MLKVADDIKQEFGDVVYRDVDGTIVVDLSAVHDPLRIIRGGSDRVLAPVGEVITFRPAERAFNPRNAAVMAGLVSLNKVSPYLADLPNGAIAELLISPRSTATLFCCDLGTFYESAMLIQSIDGRYGLHHEGQIIKGMQIFGHPDDAQGVTYEGAWAGGVRRAWEAAKSSGKDVTTGWAIGTVKLLCGSHARVSAVMAVDNMYSRLEYINTRIARQGGEQIVRSDVSQACWQFTSSELKGLLSVPCLAFYNDYCLMEVVDQFQTSMSSRPIALNVLAPSPNC